jgi:tetratricopeptide (TPR) repeat protein
MTKIPDLTFYNPKQLKDDDFLEGFVARQRLTGKILASLAEVRLSGPARHRLIVGHRGMGKTSLLRRIALGVRDKPSLSAVLLPLTFREEQYNVHTLRAFWRNCLDALGDWFESVGESDKAERIDEQLARVAATDGDEEGEAELGIFKCALKAERKRPLLLLDNIDLVFEGLRKKEWALRRVLQEPGGMVVIGASAKILEATVEHGAAFYDFFQVDVLDRLDHKELFECLKALAAKRGAAGGRVLETINSDPARIRALHDLTGGNPRTLVMLYVLLETGCGIDAMGDLGHLLDQATPLYKARVEELAPQSRVVLDAVALAWDPVTASAVATQTALDLGVVSAQLDRLLKMAMLEKTALSSKSPAGFQVSERFFNIWYLMRHGNRRHRNRLRWLSAFLRAFYTPVQLVGMARSLVCSDADNIETKSNYCLALSDATDDPFVQLALRQEVAREAPDAIRDGRAHSEVFPGGVEAQSPRTADEWLALGYAFDTKLGLCQRAEEAYRKAIAASPSRGVFWAFLGNLLHLRLKRYAEAEQAYKEAIKLGATKKYALLNNLGNLLAERLGRFAEAEMMYREAIQLDPESAIAWNGLGVLLHKHLGRYAEAETAYNKSIALNGKYVDALNNVGSLLFEHLHRHKESEKFYRRCIELSPDYASAWSNLGNLLQTATTKYDEAEACYRKAIELRPEDADAWYNLGVLLHVRFGRYEEAESCYRKAIELDVTRSEFWNAVGRLLHLHLFRFGEAESAYRKAIELAPQNASPWNNLGCLLADCLGRPEEAEKAYRKSLDVEPGHLYAVGNLAYLLLGKGEKREEAEEYYAQATKGFPHSGAALLRAYRAFVEDNVGVAVTELRGVLEENDVELISTFRDDLFRVLRAAADRGHGERLLKWFQESGMKDRFWPLVVALDAYAHGETKLRDVNPEVRNVAAKLFRQMRQGADAKGDRKKES